MEGQLAGDQVTHMRAEGQCLSIRLTEGGVGVTSRVRQCGGFRHHTAAEVNPVDLSGTWGEGACEESCPACHISDTPPRGRTRHPHDQLQQPLIGHGVEARQRHRARPRR